MTFTKERLEEIAELARKATYKPCSMHMTNLLVVCDSEVIDEMARQLLASMEQDPVAYTCSDALDDVYCGSAAMMGPAGAVGEVPLYAAPQLPQPAVLSVPDEIPKLKDGMGFKYVKDGVRYSLNYANGWNQCRAAMLQGAEPVHGWIPCSDRMPTKNDRVLIFINFNSDTVPPSIHDAQFTGSTFRRGNATVNVFPLEDGYGVTHWMQLPASPQQEVKSALEHGMQRYAGAMQKLSEGDK